ncbi:MAG: hypothetical protein SFT81_01990 [Candidatus Caenarcaniphilales bacterium]|nr:hypothetical protein [Candidatus Caenarcaniphilales bacterium]
MNDKGHIQHANRFEVVMPDGTRKIDPEAVLTYRNSEEARYKAQQLAEYQKKFGVDIFKRSSAIQEAVPDWIRYAPFEGSTPTERLRELYLQSQIDREKIAELLQEDSQLALNA